MLMTSRFGWISKSLSSQSLWQDLQSSAGAVINVRGLIWGQLGVVVFRPTWYHFFNLWLPPLELWFVLGAFFQSVERNCHARRCSWRCPKKANDGALIVSDDLRP